MLVLLIIIPLILGIYSIAYMLGDIVTPFLIAIFLAYALNPLAQKFKDRLRLGNTMASLSASGLFFGVILAILAILGPLLYYQISNLVKQIASNQEIISKTFFNILEKVDNFFPNIKQESQKKISNLSEQAINTIQVILNKILQSGSTAINTLTIIIITPFVTFYLLKDGEKVRKAIYLMIPPKYRDETNLLLSDMRKVTVGFFRGQLAVCITLAIYYTLAFFIMNLEFWLGLGVLFGFMIFIPYLGSLISTLLCIIIAIGQFGLSYHLVALGTVLTFGQIIEGGFLTPRLVGGNVGLHPVWVVFSLAAGWNIAGFFGVIISVPLAAIIGVIIKFCLHKYRNSGFYNSAK
jgi:predicted PurR-regulated permease PerM